MNINNINKCPHINDHIVIKIIQDETRMRAETRMRDSPMKTYINKISISAYFRKKRTSKYSYLRINKQQKASMKVRCPDVNDHDRISIE